MNQTPAVSVAGHLIVLKQNSAAEEKVTNNGVPKAVHVVIKNSPFVATFGWDDPSFAQYVSLDDYGWDCTLLYDTDARKAVDFVKVKPVEFKPLQSDDDGTISLEMRIKVLTSQHEDMFFRVMVQAIDPETKAPIAELSVCTHPIKVISKPEQIKRKPAALASCAAQQGQQGAAAGAPGARRADDDAAQGAATRKRSASAARVQGAEPREKRPALEGMVPQQIVMAQAPAVTAQMAEAMARIEARQEDQIRMLQQLVCAQQDEALLKKQQQYFKAGPATAAEEPEVKAEFEDTFQRMLAAYARLSPCHRAASVRRVMQLCSAEHASVAGELLDMFASEGLGRELGRSQSQKQYSAPFPPVIGQQMPMQQQQMVMMGMPPVQQQQQQQQVPTHYMPQQQQPQPQQQQGMMQQQQQQYQPYMKEQFYGFQMPITPGVSQLEEFMGLDLLSGPVNPDILL